MAKHAPFLLIFALFSLASIADENHSLKRVPVGWTVPLEALGFDGSLESLPEPRDWQVKQVSSYDRDGGNNDAADGHQVYDGGVVLVDLEGPGVITRIWTRNPHGTIYIYVDDIEHPVIVMPFRDLFTGTVEYGGAGTGLFAPPFAGEGTGGYFSYVPIPYEERCRIIVAVEEETLAYQVTYAEFPADTPIQSFELALTKDDVKFFHNWAKNWDSIDLRHPSRKEMMHHSRQKYRPGKNSMVYPIEGPGVLTEIELITESNDQDIADGTWIAIYFDGQKNPGVLAPIGDFFGASTKDSTDHSTLVIGKHGERMWCRYPMPFHESAVIHFITTSEQVADIEYYLTWHSGPVGDLEYFFARYNSAVSVAGEPYRVADIRGDGHYVGTTIAATGADSLSFLEGDDSYMIDGSTGADFHGTGTDDYFNAGWYFAAGTYNAPTHATTSKKQTAPAGFSAFRSHITEAVPFKRSFVFDLEHGPSNNQPGVSYSSVAYWYQKDATPQVWRIDEVGGIAVARP